MRGASGHTIFTSAVSNALTRSAQELRGDGFDGFFGARQTALLKRVEGAMGKATQTGGPEVVDLGEFEEEDEGV